MSCARAEVSGPGLVDLSGPGMLDLSGAGFVYAHLSCCLDFHRLFLEQTEALYCKTSHLDLYIWLTLPCASAMHFGSISSIFIMP